MRLWLGLQFKRGALMLLTIGAFLFGFNFFSLGYAPEPTHAGLAEYSAKLYNLFYGQKYGAPEIEWLRQGAINEDNAPRWLNHFYDPVTGLGWTGENLKGEAAAKVVFYQKLLVGGRALSAKDWANNQAEQSQYGLYLGDQTFDRAVYEFLMGHEKTAFLTLGHILHLIQDMTVPAHTRQDTHSAEMLGDEAPYETWAKNNFAVNNFEAISQEYPDFHCLDLDDCFDQLASYSNGYFFSKDTILSPQYQNPQVLFEQKIIINGDETRVAYGRDADNSLYPLFYYDDQGVKSTALSFIHQAYWPRLSKKAIMGGTEVLRLFDEAVAKARRDPELTRMINQKKREQENQKWVNSWITPAPEMNDEFWSFLFKPKVISPVGEADRFRRLIISAKNFLGPIVSKITLPWSTSALSFLSSDPTENLEPRDNSNSAPTLTNQEIISPASIPEPAPLAEEPEIEDAVLVEEILGPSEPSLPLVQEIIHAPWVASEFEETLQPVSQSEEARLQENQALNSLPHQSLDSEEDNTPADNINNEINRANFLAPPPHIFDEPDIIESESEPALENSSSSPETFLVARVIDGDTIELANGERVRYLGVDTPEMPRGDNQGGCFATEATDKNRELVEGQEVFLEADIQDRDDYGRLLRYVFIQSTSTQATSSQNFINDYLARQGYAYILSIEPNIKYQAQLAEAYQEAQDERRGLWGDECHPLDTTPPQISIGLENYSLFSRDLTIFWQSTSTDVSFYNLEWATSSLKDYDALTPKNWQELLTRSTSTNQFLENLPDDTIYFFRVRAEDESGNQSPWQEIQAEISTQPIIINEIAWMGTANALSWDEWIELYNKTNQTVDLDGWRLIASKSGPDIVFSSTTATTTLMAKNYFLIERTDNETVKDVLADWLTAFGNGLNDSGEALELRDNQNNLIDYVLDWYAGDKQTRSTMERVNPWLPGYLSINWQTNDGLIRNGLAADGETFINGTPKEQNSVFDANLIKPPYFWSWPIVIQPERGRPQGTSMPDLIIDEQGRLQTIVYDFTFGRANILYNIFDGQNWLDMPVQLSVGSTTNGAGYTPPKIIRNSQGELIVVFSFKQYRDGNQESYLYLTKQQNGLWSEPIKISGDDRRARHIAILSDKQDKIHLAWTEMKPFDSEIHYTFYDPNQFFNEQASSTRPWGWSEIFKVSSSSLMADYSKLALDSNDRPHLVWQELDFNNDLKALYYSVKDGENWLAPIKFFDDPSTGFLYDKFSLVIDNQDIMHLVLAENYYQPDNSSSTIYYNSAPVDLVLSQSSSTNTWFQPVVLINQEGLNSQLVLLPDVQGQLHLIWVNGEFNKGLILYARRPVGQIDWLPAANVFIDEEGNQGGPAFLIDQNNNLHLVWFRWGNQVFANSFYSQAQP